MFVVLEGDVSVEWRGGRVELGPGSFVGELTMAEGTEPPSDQAASSEFRKHLVRVLGRRALQEAAAR